MVSLRFLRVDKVRDSQQHVSVSVCLQCIKTLVPAVYRQGEGVHILQDFCVSDTHRLARKWGLKLKRSRLLRTQLVLQMFATLSFVYPYLDHSVHTSKVVSTCSILCLLDYSDLQVFDFLMFSACLHHVVLRVIVSFLRDVGSLVRVICHFVSCWDLGLFVCAFLLIIMGCSLLLSYFLFIVLILALGSSLTSQGCLRCGNQGKLCFLGV